MTSNSQELREKLTQWARSPAFSALITAYKLHHVDGTSGMHEVPEPRVFENDMRMLHMKLLGKESLYADAKGFMLERAESTLSQMMVSVEFGEQTEQESGLKLSDLFAKGKEMGEVLKHLLDMEKPHVPNQPKPPEIPRRRS